MLPSRKESSGLLIVLPWLNWSYLHSLREIVPSRLKTLQACIFQWLFLEIRLFECNSTPFVWVIYLSHYSTYSFLFIQRRSFQPVSYIDATTSRQLQETGEHSRRAWITTSKVRKHTGATHRGSVDEWLYIHLPTLRIGWSRQPPASLVWLCSPRVRHADQLSLSNHIKVLKLTSLTR